MYLAVQVVCEKKQAVWQALPAFVKSYQEFKARVATIQSFAQHQARRKTGLTEDKQRLRNDMCELAVSVAAAVKVYAGEVKNLDLLKRVSYSRTELGAARDTVSADRCRDIYAAAQENIAVLPDYGITSDSLAKFLAAIEGYATAITNPRESRVVGKTVTGNLLAEIKAADDLLRDRLDNLVQQLAGKDPVFVTDYTNARIVVGIPGTHTVSASDGKQTTKTAETSVAATAGAAK